MVKLSTIAIEEPEVGTRGKVLLPADRGFDEARLRLVAVKTRYDPHNQFRHNQNIKPFS